jgi:uncharacterized DUF497 family protein
LEFEWNEEKRQKILKERSLDFADAFQFFGGRPVIHQPTPRGDEERWKSTAVFDGTFFRSFGCGATPRSGSFR